jgi:hypothetical protein
MTIKHLLYSDHSQYGKYQMNFNEYELYTRLHLTRCSECKYFRRYTKLSENIIKFFLPKFSCTCYVTVYLYVLIYFMSVLFSALRFIDNAINIFDYITWNVRMISEMEREPKKSIVAFLFEAFNGRNRRK